MREHVAENLELTDEERAMVLKRRDEARRASEARAATRAALQIAAEYESWLQDNGRGSTFSTFVNEFGYDKLGAGDVFRRVEAIRAAARGEC